MSKVEEYPITIEVLVGIKTSDDPVIILDSVTGLKT